ncbi:MAG: class I SAM-dependent methyltransferase [Myxococcota bacterium]
MSQNRPAFDTTAAEAFGERLLETVNAGALSLMISVGHRTGLFDAMDGRPPSTSQQIADAAKLDERYVREWLGAMVTGGVVDVEAGSQTYRLPAEHAASLTRAASPANLAVTFQWIPLLGSVEEKIVDCFRNGGGVPYEAYTDFHRVMAEESDQTVVAAVVDDILPGVPGIVEKLESGIDVLDVGCGSGRAINRLAATFPNSRFTGYDFSEEAVTRANAEAERQGTPNARFVAKDAARIEDSDAFDLITAFDAIHDQVEPDAVLAGIARALRADGVFLMQDIAGTSHVHEDVDHPIGTFLYTVSCMHCMTVSLANDGAGLGAMWGRQTALRMLADAGFGNVEVKSLPHDVINLYYTARK